MAGVWAFDEGRFGLKVWFRRRWCVLGQRPPWVVEDRYEWEWVYAAVEPSSGENFFLLMPGLDQDCFQVFLEEFAKHLPGQRIGLVLDNLGTHHASAVRWPAGIEPIPLPAYSPELNPAEQVFGYLRDKLANRIFADIEELEAAITEALRVFWEDPPVLKQLTAYPWWMEGVQNIILLAS